MEHMFWHGAEGSEIYCDMLVTSELGKERWNNAIQSLSQQRPFISQPLFARTVLVDYNELKMRRLVLTFDADKAMSAEGLQRLLANEANLRQRLQKFS